MVLIAAKEFSYDIDSFSIIGRDKSYNELENIEATINDTGCKSYKIFLDSEANNFYQLKNLINYYDNPVAIISYLIHFMISKEIVKYGYKISISGSGADELFNAYYDHFNINMYELKDDLYFLSYLKNWDSHILNYVRILINTPKISSLGSKIFRK